MCLRIHPTLEILLLHIIFPRIFVYCMRILWLHLNYKFFLLLHFYYNSPRPRFVKFEIASDKGSATALLALHSGPRGIFTIELCHFISAFPVDTTTSEQTRRKFPSSTIRANIQSNTHFSYFNFSIKFSYFQVAGNELELKLSFFQHRIKTLPFITPIQLKAIQFARRGQGVQANILHTLAVSLAGLR